MIAALYVQTNGSYFGLHDVDPWDEPRNALGYDGPHPVVAHPPCSRWCQLAVLVEARWGHKRGDDGGTFAHALACVRRFGGVLEHPAYSHAWAAFDLPRPDRRGGWQRGECGGYSAHVEQGQYGHAARKATWLYAYGVELPELRWGSTPDSHITHMISWCKYRGASGEKLRRLGKAAASRTPQEFREVLIGMARSAQTRPR
jgi:hypothetical protein